ncbi:hypothetical protein HY412_00640 [Candidatus Kaiserbacteria bacterium]|nr:hypothetical protein [Candidatus Kaiserbacteria bacterium]
MFRLKKSPVVQASVPEISDEEALAEEARLRGQIDGWSSYPREPIKNVPAKLYWPRMDRPGMKAAAEVAKENIIAALLPKDPRRNRKHKKKHRRRKKP